MSGSQYVAAGVDLARGDAAKERIGRAVAGTRTTLSLGEVGACGGMVRVPAGMRKPVLVMSTDGVGTKVVVALQARRYDTVGEDLVNHSVNDILVGEVVAGDLEQRCFERDRELASGEEMLRGIEIAFEAIELGSMNMGQHFSPL